MLHYAYDASICQEYFLPTLLESFLQKYLYQKFILGISFSDSAMHDGRIAPFCFFGYSAMLRLMVLKENH